MTTTFSEKCYEALRKVPRGMVTTYKDIALQINTKAYRAVGSAMNKNPYPRTEVPCHRVVTSDGSLGGYAQGETKKIAMLKAEGIAVSRGKIINFEQHHFTFDTP